MKRSEKLHLETFPHGRVNIFLFILSLLSLGALLLLGVFTLFQGEGTTTDKGYFKTLINGQRRIQFQKNFDQNVILKEEGIEFWGQLRFSLLSEGAKGVLLGDEGWLFTSEEYESFLKESLPKAEIEELILRADHVLKEQGVRLVIVPLPSKSRLYKEYNPRYPLSSALSDRYENFIAFLRLQDIGHVNLKASFEEEGSLLFYKADTHWNDSGARRAAEEISLIIDPLAQQSGAIRGVFQTENKGTLNFTGDLVSYLPQAAHSRYEEEHGQWVTTQIDPPLLGLFDTPTIPLVLVGTSYSFDKRWNFEGFLKESLSLDLLNVAQEGKGPFIPMEELLDKGFYADVGASFVLWEIPERYLSLE